MHEETAPQPWHPGFRAGFGTWLGFALVAFTNAVVIAIFLPRPATGIWTRVHHHLFDASGIVGVGMIAAMVVGTGTKVSELGELSARKRWFLRMVVFVAYVGLTAPITAKLVGYEAGRIVLAKLSGRFQGVFQIVMTVLTSIAIPTAYWLGGRAARSRKWRIGVLLVGLVVMIGNHFVYRDDYFGVHGALAWFIATLMALPLASAAEFLVIKMQRRTRATAMVVAGCAGLAGLLVPPSATVRAEMFREPGAISAWILATTIWRMPGGVHTQLPAEVTASPYFQRREGMAAIVPTTPPLLPGRAPLIVLLTIDATRADTIDLLQNETYFPALARLKRQGAYFTRTTSPGSQTAVSLSSLFSGRYYSQLEWHDYGQGILRFLYPAKDESLRFPEILAKRGINTVNFCSISFLANAFGVARGFSEENIVTRGREHATAEQVMNPLLERLGRAEKEPMFVYAHLTEPHWPYDRGGTDGPDMQRYLQEIRLADEYIGKLVNLLETRFAGRGYLFISSDHGEAFGEHGTTKHTKTLYEELLRVPLIMYGPGIVARRIEQHVTLMDLGPTILDIFGVDTPATYMGQSLVPLLAGRDVQLERPILAEGRMRRVLYWGDLKVIDDPRRKVVEVFDLQRDPRELRNRFDTDRARALPALHTLRHFFDVHRLRRAGYEMPYKP